MTYTISELIDIDELRSLCELFTRMTGFVTAILDMEGNILIATGWQDICTRFHRAIPGSAARCRESDVYLAGKLRQGDTYTLYACRNGLVDVAVPIVVAGRQVGKLYSGQFLFAPPDMDFFRRQGAEFGFDEASYLEALARVPIVSEERVRLVMEFLCRLAEMIGRMGLASKNARQARLVVENSPVTLFRWKAAEGWPVEFVSENVVQFGYAPEELLSGRVSFASLIHPADLERVMAEVRGHGDDASDMFSQEYRVVTKCGEVRWVDDRTTVERDGEGMITHYQGIVMDITERRHAAEELAMEKERLAVTLRSIGDGVITTDMEGRVILLNKVAEELTGWKQEEARGKAFDEVFRIIDERTRQLRSSPVAHVLKNGSGSEIAHNTLLVARGGRERLIADSVAPIRDRESRLVGVVLVFRDITEEKRIEQELFNVHRLESIGVLAGGIAHDFNNLLTAILGNISLSKMLVPEGDRMFRNLDEAEKASLRAKGLTQQLLTFSRGGAPVRRTLSLAALIRESAAFTLSGARSTCRFSLPEDLWPVEADDGQISQVINNLVLNADQAMPGGGEIEISCVNVVIDAKSPLPLPAGAHVRIAVSDRGQGIPQDAITRIFDPYFTTKRNGTGLGLATVHSIIRSHDGHIAATSRQGGGSTFTIHLPALVDVEVLAAPEETAVDLGRGTVLVMDDEESIREIAGEMLSYLGYAAAFARDGAEAVELYRRAREGGQPFNVVLMDLTIPGGMGGKEAIVRLRQMDESVLAVVSSGYSTDPIMADYHAYGFSGVITKPYRVGELKSVLDQLLAR
jgi:PAS domain S-box-containing protein